MPSRPVLSMTSASDRRAVLCALLAALLASVARADDKPAVANDHAAQMTRGIEIFKKQVKAVLPDRCVKCHGGKKTESAFDLPDRGRLLRGGESGPAIIAGNSKDSLLYKLVNHGREPYMPK